MALTQRVVIHSVARLATPRVLHPEANLFAPAWSLLVLLAWPAATLLAAAVITRRDA